MRFQQKTISGLFDGEKNFTIPVYQRAYSWEEKQWRDFYLDLKEQTRYNSEYFYGNILLQTIKKDHKYNIIDGQQRLTSITIFLRSLFNIFKERNLGEKINIEQEILYRYFVYFNQKKLRPVEYDQIFYDALIIENKEVLPQSVSQKRILEAKNFFEMELKKEETDFLIKIFEKISNANVAVVELENSRESALIFELQNNRGKDLTNMEKLKSFFMYQLCVNDAEQQIDEISKIYEEIYRKVYELKTINEDSVLIYHCNAFLNCGFNYRNLNDLKKEYSESKNKVDFIKKFIFELKNSFDYIIDYQKFEFENAYKLSKLNAIAFAYPFIILGYKHNRSGLNSLLKILEIIAFRNNLTNTRANLQRRLKDCLKNYKGNNEKLKDDIKEKIKDYWNFNRMKEILNGNMYFNRVIKYLLFEYERYIQNKGYKIQDIEIKDASIEHISPKTPENGEQLAKGYDEHDENFVEEYLDNIGNLMVISQSQNSSIGNRPFREKLESYESNPLLNQQKEIKDFLIDGKIEWKRESINKRKEKIVNFALQNWDFDNIKF